MAEAPQVELDVEELLELIGLLEVAAERLRELASEGLGWRPLIHRSRDGEHRVGYWRRLCDMGDGWITAEVKPEGVRITRWEDHRPLRWLWRELKRRVDGRIEVADGLLRIHLQPQDDEAEAERERRLEAALRMTAWSLWALRRPMGEAESHG
jgi:hypothetical protein